jgi:outer membrane protein assembly factor BamB
MIRRRRAGVVLFAGIAALLVAACGPIHADPRWASVSKVDETGYIAVAFADRVTLVDPTDGRAVELLDRDGEERLDDEGNVRTWEFRASDQQTRFYAHPVRIEGDRLLFSSYDKRLLEADLTAPDIPVGGSVTVDENQNIVAPPVVDDDLIIQGLADHDVVALDVDDKTEVWRFSTEYGVWDAPVIEAGVVYFTSMDHFLYALDRDTGDEIWKIDLEGAMPSAPVYENGVLFVGSFARKVFAVAASNGEILATFESSDWVWATPSFDSESQMLYVSDMGGMVYALDASSLFTGDGLRAGELVEDWSLAVSEKSIAQSPLITEEYIIVGSRDHNVYWIDRERGSITDTREVAGEVMSEILLIESGDADVSEPLVVVSTSANQELLVAFSLEDGRREWVYGR